MPQNTTASNLGTEVGYQNPASVNLVLDGEVVGPDPVTAAQLTREFVVPQDSVSGNSTFTLLYDLIGQVLSELKYIRILLQIDTVPGSHEIVDELEDKPPAEELDATGVEEI
jgi:hypothetical protein